MLSKRAATRSTRSSGRGTTTIGTSIPPHICVLLYSSRQHMPGTLRRAKIAVRTTDAVRLQAWRNQSRMPTNARSCKHLRALLGDAYEDARLKLKNPDGDTFGQNSRAKPASKAKGKGKAAASPRKKKAAGGDDDQDDDEDDEDAPKKKVPELLLANKWDLDDGPDPTGWWMSEKLDGVRYAAFSRMLCVMLISDPSSTYWDGKQMLSRLGNPFTPPDWFLESMSGRRGIFLRIHDSSRAA
jgi:hypothetical protein